MAVAFEEFVARRRDIGGLISAGGSGGTALATRAMRRLPIGVPKVMVSTVASADVRPYVGPSDDLHDALGHRRLGHQPHLGAGARERRDALAGMLAFFRSPAPSRRRASPPSA